MRLIEWLRGDTTRKTDDHTLTGGGYSFFFGGTTSGRPVTIWLNSPGGDVVAAAQIYNMLIDYPGTVTVNIDGIAASAADVSRGHPTDGCAGCVRRQSTNC